VTVTEDDGLRPAPAPNRDLYPDLAAAGSLAAALTEAARRMAVEIGIRPPRNRNQLIAASIHTPRGRFGVSTGAVERWFITSLWRCGVELTRGNTKDLAAVVGAAATWAGGASLAELCAAWPHLGLWELAQAHERGPGDAVALKWQRLRQHAAPIVAPLVEAAYAEPWLRVLYPFTSHYDLHFSRCTGFPYSFDVPFIQHLAGWRYLVAGPRRGSVIGEADDPQPPSPLLSPAFQPAVAPRSRVRPRNSRHRATRPARIT
jgi:Family of unknown function (DUF6193)